MNTENRVVIITGAASGIGKATAIAFAEAANKLVLIDINGDDLKIIADDCRKRNNEVLEFKADITKDDEVKQIIDSAIKEFDKIDVLINCAGILQYGDIFTNNLLEIYDRVMSVNMRSILLLTHIAVPYLVKTKGCIVNVSSVGSESVISNHLPYLISKAALTHFTKAVALELAPKGVRVNSVHPGSTRTNIISNNFKSKEEEDAQYDKYLESVPLKRVIEPKEVADLIYYLASEKAKSVTGAKYFIDGGSALC